jgi:hypothetical protein
MRMLLIAAMLPLVACHSNAENRRSDADATVQGEAAKPSGSGATRSFAATGFTGVDLAGSDDVDVKQGAAFSVTAEGDPRILDALDIRVDNGTLRVGRKRGAVNLADDKGAKVHVVMPKLTSASLGGSGNLDIARAEGDFEGSLAGSGNLRIADLHGGDAALSLAGSGDLTVAGSITKLSANVAGSGNLQGERLSATSADVAIAGSGSVRAVVKGPADVSLLGSGEAALTGGAKCTVSAIGSGEAHCS